MSLFSVLTSADGMLDKIKTKQSEENSENLDNNSEENSEDLDNNFEESDNNSEESNDGYEEYSEVIEEECEILEAEEFDNNSRFKSGNDSEEKIESDNEVKASKKNLLNAKLNISIYDMVISQACSLLSGDYDNDKRFKLKQGDKKEIAELWGQVLDQSDKIQTPQKQLNKMLIAHASVLIAPLLIGLIASQIKKRKAKKQKANERTNYKTNTDFNEPNNSDFSKASENDSEVQNNETKYEIVRHKDSIQNENKNLKDNIEKPKDGRKNNGRKKGDKKNPETGKFEAPIKSENDINYYSWGAEFKIK